MVGGGKRQQSESELFPAAAKQTWSQMLPSLPRLRAFQPSPCSDSQRSWQAVPLPQSLLRAAPLPCRLQSTGAAPSQGPCPARAVPGQRCEHGNGNGTEGLSVNREQPWLSHALQIPLQGNSVFLCMAKDKSTGRF